MKSRLAPAIAFAIFALVAYRALPGISRVEAARLPQYVAIKLGTLGGPHSYATGINNKEQVVGLAYVSDNVFHAFLWENGVMRDLGTLGGSQSAAYGINEHGTIVGESEPRGTAGTHAVVWEAGQIRDIHPDGYAFSTALAINDHGEIAGICVLPGSYPSDIARPCVWINGVARELEIPSNIYVSPRAINNRGEITGEARYKDQNTSSCIFRWVSGLFEILGSCSGGVRGIGINDRGQILGTNCLLYDRGTVTTTTTELGCLAINKSGQIAGNGSNGHAWLWDDGTLIDVDPDRGTWNGRRLASYASALNDRAEVVGRAESPGPCCDGPYIAHLWRPMR